MKMSISIGDKIEVSVSAVACGSRAIQLYYYLYSNVEASKKTDKISTLGLFSFALVLFTKLFKLSSKQQYYFFKTNFAVALNQLNRCGLV